MKVITIISKVNDSRVGVCLDWSTVGLVTWLKNDQEVKCAVDNDWSASNIFKVVVGNRIYPMWHPLGWYIDSYTTRIITENL